MKQLSQEEHSVLTEMVRQFLINQQGYDPHQRINIFYENNDLCILYGKHFESSITAKGQSPDLLFEDFINNWQGSESNQNIIF